MEFVRRSLGVMPQVGGEHPRMGTHNFLLKLGDSIFLEVISPNPNVPKPERPRWFELDRLESNTPPRLATCVARTADVHSALAMCSEHLGKVEPMSRGQLNWLMTIPSDGSLPFNGIAPTLIEWHTEAHLATKLQDVGCSFVRLEAFHSEAQRISALLKSISVEGEISVAPLPAGAQPYLVAYIQTPSGLRKLCAP
ncbi:MAG: VOC family protein [Betaproteobacteria bacterium]|nr:MAG: VOC family protein [Betaproteobacteria bacterium]